MEQNTNSNNFIIIGLAVLFVIIVVGFLASNSGSEPAAVTQVENTDERESIDSKNPTVANTNVTDEMEKSEVMMKKEDENMDDSEEEMMDKPDKTMEKDLVAIDTEPIKVSKGTYATYNANAVANSNADDIVLFFKANWCPSCNALNKNITANMNSIPAGTEIYTVDFDTSQDLRKKYGVTTQHTLVHIKSDGTMINKFTGNPTLESILASL